MKHAFIFLCHKYTVSLQYNLKKIELHPDAFAYVHVDAKSNIHEFDFINSFKKVFFVQNRVNVKWGHFSQVESTISSLRNILKNQFDYVSIMSGEDLFVKPISLLNEYIVEQNHREFIGVANVKGQCLDFKTRCQYIYPPCFYERSKSMYLRTKRAAYKLLFTFGFFKNPIVQAYDKIYKGSNWFTLSNSCIEYVINEIDVNPSLLKYFESSFCSDELFFQSIIMNSKFSEKVLIIEDDNESSLRYVDWESGPDYPKVFQAAELLVNFPKNTFIIRKVSSKISLDFLEKNFV